MISTIEKTIVCGEIKLIERLAEAEVKMLMHLLDKVEIPLTDFTELHLGYGTVYRALGNLKEMNLVKERSRGIARLISLTEKGTYVAEKLRELDDYIIKN